MTEPLRNLYLLKPDSPEGADTFVRVSEAVSDLSPTVVTSENLMNGLALEGSVLLIPPGQWRSGVISDLTRFANLSIIALVGESDAPDRVDLWYVMGAALVFDAHASPAVLRAALLKLMELELSTLRQQLTRKESLIFELLRRAGKTGLDRMEMAEMIWNDRSIQSNTIDVHIFNLRRKLNSTRFKIVYQDRRFVIIEQNPSV